jgi:hypothetical protein
LDRSTRFDVLPITSWQNGRVDVRSQFSNFKRGESAYLHIINEHNKASDPIAIRVGAGR